MRGKNPASATGARAYLNASNALMSAGEEMSAGTPPPRGAIAPAGREVAPNRAPSLWSRRVGTRQSELNGRQRRQPASRDRDSQTRRRSGGESPRRFRMASSPRRITKAFFHRPAATKKRKPRSFSSLPQTSVAHPRRARWRPSRRAGRRPRFSPGRPRRGSRGRCAGTGCGGRSPGREVGRRERRRERTCARATSASAGARRRFCPGGDARARTDRRPSRRRLEATTRGRRRQTEKKYTTRSLSKSLWRSPSRRASLWGSSGFTARRFRR
jgi:hypothetical protein